MQKEREREKENRRHIDRHDTYTQVVPFFLYFNSFI